MKTKTCLFVLFVTCSIGTSNADAVFGRLYTSPSQRDHLDEARNEKPQGEIIINIVADDLLEAEVDDEITATQSITLDGIVYRTDGKNTAWINRNSTNEGNLETQFTKVDESDVRSNQVRIILPDNQTRIELKVGQQYDINSKEIHDMMKDPPTTTPADQSEGRRQ